MAEIDWSEDRYCRPDPGRTLMQDGKWIPDEKDRPADWREREIHARARSDGNRFGALGASAPGARSFAARAPDGLELGKSRASAAHQRTPWEWNRMHNITPELILAGIAAGKSQVEIARENNCAYSVVIKRMVAWRRQKRAAEQA